MPGKAFLFNFLSVSSQAFSQCPVKFSLYCTQVYLYPQMFILFKPLFPLRKSRLASYRLFIFLYYPTTLSLDEKLLFVRSLSSIILHFLLSLFPQAVVLICLICIFGLLVFFQKYAFCVHQFLIWAFLALLCFADIMFFFFLLL